MRTVLLIAALMCLCVVAAVGFDVVDLSGTTADTIARMLGWLGLGGVFYVGSHLVGDWP